MKNTKKSLLMSAISLLLCISMLISSTFAWFTDSVTSAGNKIQSGTLKIDLELLDEETSEWNSLKENRAPIFNYDKWEPGYVDTKVLKVENEGSLALKWVAQFCSEQQLSILADVIDVYVCASESEIGYPEDRNLDGYTCVGNLTTFINSIEKTTRGTLEAGEVAYLGIALKMREDAGNEYQNLSLGGAFDIRIYATQYTSESDSFDNQYDKNSMFDILADKSILTSQTKYLMEGAETAEFALYHKGTRIVSVSVPEDAIANPNEPITVNIRAIDPYIAASENTQSYAYDIEVTNLKANLKGDQLVTVVVAAPKGLAAMQAYHKGALMEDAVYDEVAGTITFKTASFSPFDFTSNVEEVESLDELRAVLQNDGHTAKLTKNITVDLTKDTGAARDINHAYVGSKTYYNGVMINRKNVGLDLNGHSITAFCGDDYNSNSDVGALFFVGKEGSLNITNTGAVETGFIKMASSIYAVWAPFADPSYVDIYGGAFIADYYAGDTVGTPLGSDGKYDPENGTMSITQENSNRSIIYAGHGGNINVYGGYFLYNNTINDKSNRNNGAFNAKDYYEAGALITIHEGVYLSNKEYRQNPYRNPQTNPSFDDYSIKLADEELYQVSKVELDEAVKIDDKDYSTWYQVSRAFKYQITFKDANGDDLDTLYIKEDGAVTVDDIDNTAFGKLTGEYANDFDGWVNTASEKITTIPSTNTTDIVLYPKLAAKYTVRWVDEDGNIIHSVTTTQTTYGELTAPSNPASQYDNMAFDHWEIREKDANGKVTYTNVSSDYSITKDITLYPYYTYNAGEGSIALMGHDDDGDGRYDRYTVEAAKGLNGSVRIPGKVNGVRVEAITDLSSDTLNGLWGGGITSVIIEDGVQEIGSRAFAETADLNYVEVPTSVTKIGANAFSSVLGAVISKKVTIKYAGTWAQWQAACNTETSTNTNWDSGLGDGSKVECTDGTYVLDTSWGDYDHNWGDWKKQ